MPGRWPWIKSQNHPADHPNHSSAQEGRKLAARQTDADGAALRIYNNFSGIGLR
jgi:hypothetical protein